MATLFRLQNGYKWSIQRLSFWASAVPDDLLKVNSLGSSLVSSILEFADDTKLFGKDNLTVIEELFRQTSIS